MEKITIDRDKLDKLLRENPLVERDLERRSKEVLSKLKELAPKDTGDLAVSLRIESSSERGTKVFRIVSDDPQFQAIIHGTKGPYTNAPSMRPGSPLGEWASRHQFTTSKSRYMLSRSIAVHGTKPAGTFTGRANWISEAIREAV